MSNADMPAMPQSSAVDENGTVVTISEWAGETGLTKREHFAGLAMQGWLARCANVPHTASLEPGAMAEVAVEMADALLKQLEK